MSDEPEKTKKQREYRKASVNVYLDAKAFLRASDREMMEALGYSENSWMSWVQSGEMPFVASIACEGLMRRRRLEENGELETSHVLITLENGRPKSFVALPSVKTIALDGKDYYLVPKKAG